MTVTTNPAQTQPKAGPAYLQREISLWPLSRKLDFPVEIDTDKLEATLENGILQIQVPKGTAGKHKIIRVGQAA